MRKWTQRGEVTCLKFHSLQEVGLSSAWCGRGTLPMDCPLSRALGPGSHIGVHRCFPGQAIIRSGDDLGDPRTPAGSASSLGRPSCRCLLESGCPHPWRCGHFELLIQGENFCKKHFIATKGNRQQDSCPASFRSGRAGFILPFSSWVTLSKSLHLSETQFSDLGVKCDHACQVWGTWQTLSAWTVHLFLSLSSWSPQPMRVCDRRSCDALCLDPHGKGTRGT